MISGAPSSSSFLRRLFRFMTLLYRSFKSDVANLPPSSGTRGLKSGGSIGILVSIIHSGLFFDCLKASTILCLFAILALFIGEVTLTNSAFSCSESSTRSIFLSISLIVSAPIPTLKLGPNSSRSLLYLSSLRTSPNFSAVLPGSRTTYAS